MFISLTSAFLWILLCAKCDLHAILLTIFSLIYELTYLLEYLLVYLPNYLPTYLLAYLLSYMLTYVGKYLLILMMKYFVISLWHPTRCKRRRIFGSQERPVFVKIRVSKRTSQASISRLSGDAMTELFTKLIWKLKKPIRFYRDLMRSGSILGPFKGSTTFL